MLAEYSHGSARRAQLQPNTKKNLKGEGKEEILHITRGGEDL